MPTKDSQRSKAAGAARSRKSGAKPRAGKSAAHNGGEPVPAAARARRKAAKPRSVAGLVTAALEDLKAQQVASLDVRHLTSVTDTMVIAGGRSDRHVRALADAVVERCKAAGVVPIGVEGHDAGEWVLVDLADVVVHVMLPRVREFYNLEKLWDIDARETAVEH